VNTCRYLYGIIGVPNPYESPTTQVEPPVTPISDGIVRQLIDGVDTETLVFDDVSDCQIYGSQHKRRLSGGLAAAAESAGCVPTVYQSVLWFCLVFVPVWPLGTYFIIPCAECDDPDRDADQYRGVRANWDTSQVVVHYSVLVAHVVAIGTLVVWCGWA